MDSRAEEEPVEEVDGILPGVRKGDLNARVTLEQKLYERFKSPHKKQHAKTLDNLVEEGMTKVKEDPVEESRGMKINVEETEFDTTEKVLFPSSDPNGCPSEAEAEEGMKKKASLHEMEERLKEHQDSMNKMATPTRRSGYLLRQSSPMRNLRHGSPIRDQTAAFKGRSYADSSSYPYQPEAVKAEGGKRGTQRASPYQSGEGSDYYGDHGAASWSERVEANAAKQAEWARRVQESRERARNMQGTPSKGKDAADAARAQRHRSIAETETLRWQSFDGAGLSDISMKDIPFPKDVKFVWRHQLNTDEKKAGFKQLAMRWHPDKFIQKFGNHLKEKERDEIMLRVNDVFRCVQQAFKSTQLNLS